MHKLLSFNPELKDIILLSLKNDKEQTNLSKSERYRESFGTVLLTTPHPHPHPSRITYSARPLEPGFTVNLHGETFSSAYHDGGTLRQPSAGGTDAPGNQTRMDGILQSHDFYHLVSNIWNECQRDRSINHTWHIFLDQTVNALLYQVTNTISKR